jgi:nitrite reductase/ring-hydroxylating ferredoxin subunit
VYAISDRCSHLGGPLSRGKVDGTSVTCPWHGSVFDMRDGRLEHGPATAPQPAFDVREHEGSIEVRARA